MLTLHFWLFCTSSALITVIWVNYKDLRCFLSPNEPLFLHESYLFILLFIGFRIYFFPISLSKTSHWKDWICYESMEKNDFSCCWVSAFTFSSKWLISFQFRLIFALIPKSSELLREGLCLIASSRKDALEFYGLKPRRYRSLKMNFLRKGKLVMWFYIFDQSEI